MCRAKEDAVGPSRCITTESTGINRGRGVFKTNFESQPEGRMQRLFILLVGTSVCLALITPLRAQPGALDPTFNTTFNWQPPDSRVSALAAQTDDKLLIGGSFQTVNGTR